jgi:hypothetical protein
MRIIVSDLLLLWLEHSAILPSANNLCLFSCISLGFFKTLLEHSVTFAPKDI